MSALVLVYLLGLLVTVLVLTHLYERRVMAQLRSSVDDYRRAFPDGCFVCSYDRWCVEHGVENEIGQFPHRCPERLRALRGEP